jgi:hypothetical protein
MLSHTSVAARISGSAFGVFCGAAADELVAGAGELAARAVFAAGVLTL